MSEADEIQLPRSSLVKYSCQSNPCTVSFSLLRNNSHSLHGRKRTEHTDTWSSQAKAFVQDVKSSDPLIIILLQYKREGLLLDSWTELWKLEQLVHKAHIQLPFKNDVKWKI